jgi:hypothetical protein
MNLGGAITIGITIAGFVGGVIIKIADISIQLGRILQRVNTNEERDREERAKAREKFSDLYSRSSSHESLLAVLVEKIDGIKEDTKDIKDALKKEKHE